MNKEPVHFSVDAALIDRLGKELVSRSETAVSELIKNAYDADATLVEISFVDINSNEAKIIVEDNGEGMSRDTLINAFLRISSGNKITNPLSKKFNRVRAGRKGIGRFATHRLGEKLTILTKAIGDKNGWKLEVNWNDYTVNKNLSEITNVLEPINNVNRIGTKIIIECLRDEWTDSAIKRIYRYSSDVQKPAIFPSQKMEKSDDIFETKFYKVIDNHREIFADPTTEYFDNSVAIIEGSIDENHNAFVEVTAYPNKVEQLKFTSERFPIFAGDKESKEKYNKIKNIKIHAYYFIFTRGEFIPGTQLKAVQEFCRNNGGIKLYRNGFKVPPYGSIGDDWLKLDEAARKRRGEINISNLHLVGYAEINEESEKKMFEETSSREGLIENEEFLELKDFLFKSILRGIQRIQEARNKVAAPINLIEISADFIKTINKLSNEDKEIKQELIEFHEQFKEKERRYLKEIEFLRILSSMGLLIGFFVHQIKQYIPSLIADILNIRENENDKDLIRTATIRMEDNVNTFKTYTSYFDSSISQNVKRDLKPQNLKKVIPSFIKAIEPELKTSGIQFKQPIYIGYDLFSCPMHPSEWSAILFNLYTNSKKAIIRAGRAGKLWIKVGRFETKVFVEFHDNGDGIPKENRERIFDAFFTTSNPVNFDADEIEELTGSGLGLKIVNDIITSYNGNIRATDSLEEGFITCMRIEIEANKENL